VKYQSGIIPIQAQIPNTEEKLLPGMYASLDVLLPGHTKKIVVPASAVAFNLYGETVYVIDQTSDTVRQVTVETGATRNNTVVVEQGLKAGDLVVVAGQLKLSNGSKVKVVEGQTLPEMTAIPVQ
jgi:membrane fusion protein (multidrug efflux system)